MYNFSKMEMMGIWLYTPKRIYFNLQNQYITIM